MTSSPSDPVKNAPSTRTVIRFRGDLADHTAYLNVSGPIDENTADSVHRRLIELLNDDLRRLVLRLRHVPFMNSAGVAVFLLLIKEAFRRGIEVILLEPSPAARRALGMVDIEALATVYDTIEDCADCVSSTPSKLRQLLKVSDEQPMASSNGGAP